MIPRYLPLLAALALSSGLLATRALAQGFEAATRFDGLFPSASGTIVVADFNRDGHPDYAVTMVEADSVAVFFGDGRGGMAPRKAFRTAPIPRGLAVADLDRDGYQDLVAAASGGAAVSVLIGLPNGEFVAHTEYGTLPSPFAVAIADIDNDDKLDLVVGGTVEGSLSILRGTGTGAFAPKVDLPIGALPYAIAAGDVDNDGKIDVVTRSTNKIVLLRGEGDGGFEPGIEYTVGDDPVHIALGDLNADGILDCAAACYGGDEIHLLIGNGVGFGPGGVLVPGIDPLAVAIGDVTGDGLADVVGVVQDEANAKVYAADGLGGLLPGQNVPIGLAGRFVVLADSDHDGRNDLVVTTESPLTRRLSVLRSWGTGPFSAKTDFATLMRPSTVRFADLNGDSHLDLVHTDYLSSTIGVRLGNGVDGLGARADVPSPVVHPGPFDVADVNGDGFDDLAIVSQDRDSVYLALGTGGGTLLPGDHFAVGSVPWAVTFTHANADALLDLLVVNANGNSMTILLNTGGGMFGLRTDVSSTATPQDAAIADLDHDGDGDLVYTTYPENRVNVRKSNGLGGYAGPILYASGVRPVAMGLADMNEDGHLDVLTANYTSGTVSLLLNDGTGALAPKVDFPGGSAPSDIAVTDIDGDLRLDVALANQGTHDVTVLLGNGRAFLGPSHAFASGTTTTTLALGDLDEDGRPDLASANFEANSVSVRLSRAATSLRLTATPNPCALGSPLTLIAFLTVPDGTQPPAGSVRFFDGLALLGTVPVNPDGSVALQFITTDAWFRTFRAEFTGSNRLRPSASGPLPVMVYGTSVDVGRPVPPTLALQSPHPNPWRSGLLTVRLALPSEVEGPAWLALYDVRGRRVHDIEVGQWGPGTHVVTLPANGLASGLYVLRLTAGKESIARRVVVLDD